ncbi:hypothetical protein CYMTET_2587 [Cymbomonas tetramitiformis]|uniref:Uncharacterized protein n=1 Tax=Cymbomonas tetramitiformis TaxID=36881 RepID=A0AAE0H4R1_9CHLO|nr:hypothetical protein CYMTET_2775 [Cymbomonas tetramitiformis]KAK3289984.1 hypothetical protein CYMTET_2587 [Cymbomonas tetramitiformis]
MKRITTPSEALRVVLEHCHRRVLLSRPRGPSGEPGHGCSHEEGDGHEEAYLRVAQLLSQALHMELAPPSTHRAYDFETLTYATTRTHGRFVPWTPAPSDMRVTDEEDLAQVAWYTDRAGFCSAARQLLLRASITANLHSLHLKNVPLHNRSVKSLVRHLHACPNLTTFVVDEAKVYGLFDNASTDAPAWSRVRGFPAMRTFVASYSKHVAWVEHRILTHATFMTTLYLRKTDLMGAWAEGAELPSSLRVVYLHDVRADAHFWAALARTTALGDCRMYRCLDYLSYHELFDVVLPAWQSSPRANLRCVMVEMTVSYLRNANLRYRIGQQDRILDSYTCNMFVSAFGQTRARDSILFDLQLFVDGRPRGEIVNMNSDYKLGHDIVTSHATDDVLHKLRQANGAMDA